MWVVLNPAKGHRFTTKGINLHKGAPTAFVDPSMPDECKLVINRAIADGRILSIAGNATDEMIIPNQAKLEKITDKDTNLQASVTHQRNKNGKILATTIVMPDRDGNTEVKSAGPLVILTGITDTPLDELEDESKG